VSNKDILEKCEGMKQYLEILRNKEDELLRQNNEYKQLLDSALQTNKALIIKYKEITEVLDSIKSLPTSGTMRENPFNTALRMIDEIWERHKK